MMLPLFGSRTSSVPTIDAGIASAPSSSGSTTAAWMPLRAPRNIAATMVTA